MPERHRLLIDASAATTGGGPADVKDIVLAAREITPGCDLLVLASPVVRAALDPAPPRVAVISAAHRGGVLGRLVWQQAVVPWKLRRTSLTGVLGPIGSFPLVLALRRAPTAVVVSNMAPFEMQRNGFPRTWADIRLRLLRFLTTLCVRFADKTWALSHDSRDMIDRHARSRSLDVLPVVPPGPHNAPRVPGRRSRHRFVVVADLHRHKGVEDAIRATHQLTVAGHEVELVIRGREMDPTYAGWLRSLVDGKAVRFEGPSDRRQAIELIAGARALIHCSRIESLGRPLAEAMSVGTPIIAAELTVTREVCGDAALYYTPGNFEALAALMSQILSDDEAAIELGKRGTTRMLGRSWLDAPRLVLRDLLARGSSGRDVS